MGDREGSGDWDRILLRPSPDWQSKPCPVVKRVLIDTTSGQVLNTTYCRVTPALREGAEGEEYVSLNYEKGDGHSFSLPNIKVVDLKAGFINIDTPDRVVKIEFAGFTTDAGHKKRVWSTF